MQDRKPKLLLAVRRDRFDGLFAEAELSRIGGSADVIDAPIPDDADAAFLARYGSEAEIVVSSWHTAAFDADVLAALPKLRWVFHAAGSVRPIVTDAMWDRSVRLISGNDALARSVAEFALAMTLLAAKRTFWGALACRAGAWRDGLNVFGRAFELPGRTVGIIGAGSIGWQLAGLLDGWACDLLVYDPHAPDERVAEIGARRAASLDELFSASSVVHLCAPLTAETRGMIRGEHSAKLPDGAVFINTARGAIVNEPEMIAELCTGRFVACLDVTDGEPPSPDSPLRRLPNVWLTPHEGGAIAENLRRIGRLVAGELEALVNGRELTHEVTREHLKGE